ncbi:hypothetical protein M0813_22694 [Anaeramoeba flamelloides]|uniref:LAGLIDADG homing endonuclease n=1 Tax=Anaeramoeba flamelloides TaxID=1746091 RepID=A0ABQ8YDC7_9EUKA|nr:hypothetical protein M0813_22694 [Anaeramoeba flamelloides]
MEYRFFTSVDLNPNLEEHITSLFGTKWKEKKKKHQNDTYYDCGEFIGMKNRNNKRLESKVLVKSSKEGILNFHKNCYNNYSGKGINLQIKDGLNSIFRRLVNPFQGVNEFPSYCVLKKRMFTRYSGVMCELSIVTINNNTEKKFYTFSLESWKIASVQKALKHFLLEYPSLINNSFVRVEYQQKRTTKLNDEQVKKLTKKEKNAFLHSRSVSYPYFIHHFC